MNRSRVLKDTITALVYSRSYHTVSIIFDITSIVYFMVSFFVFEVPLIGFEIFLGVFFLCEYILLLWSSENKMEHIRNPLEISNVLIIVGYLAAPFWNLGVLRIFRVLRITHLYQIISDARYISRKFVIWERVLTLAVHVCILTFVMSEVVFVLQADINSDVNSRFDAFYFTFNAITKVGDGDQIMLVGTQGKVLTLLVAFLSLSVFLQLLDTAADVLRASNERKKADKDLEENLPEYYCTFCDIKNRDKMSKRRR